MKCFRTICPQVLALFLWFPVEAQQPRFGETIEVKLIQIDVIVTDRDGNRIRGLRVDDFDVFEGRRRQEITNFTEYRSTATGPNPEAASTELSAEPRTFLVLIDSLPRAGFVRSTVFENLENLLSKVMRDGDRVGIVFWDPGLARATTIVEPSSEAGAAKLALRRLAATPPTGAAASTPSDEVSLEQLSERAMREQSARGASIDVASQRTSSERFAAETELMQFRRKTSAMRRLVTSVAAGPGKKSVLYVSHNFALPKDPSARLAAITMVDEVVKTTNAVGVTFYAVRPAIPDVEDGTQMDALRRLTDPTGGLIDFGPRSVETLGAKLVDDLESYYSIAYRARSDGRDRERRIMVRTKNRQYRVRARSSFVEKSNETMARDMLLARLFTDEGGDDLRFAIDEGAPRRTTGDRWLLPIILKIPVDQLQFEPEGGNQVARVKIMIVAGNGIAEVTKVSEDNLRVVAGKDTSNGFVRYSVQILADRRGSEVSIGVFDRRSGLVGVRTIDNRSRFR